MEKIIHFGGARLNVGGKRRKQRLEWLLIVKDLGDHDKGSGVLVEKMECPSKEFKKGRTMIRFSHCCLIQVISQMVNQLLGWG